MNETPENSVPTPLQPPKKRRRVHRPASGPKIERAVAEMRAVGLSQKSIAAKLDISQQTVSQVLKGEHVQVDKVDQGDAKGFDQAMRGVHSVERIRSSVVNEPKKVEMAGSAPMQIDVRAILAKLAED